MALHIASLWQKARRSIKEEIFVARRAEKNVTQQVVRFKSERPTGVEASGSASGNWSPHRGASYGTRKPGPGFLTGSSWELDSQDR
ncbi:hypothetical protein V8C34DRAFT_36521 [Trichoderma compactum]